MPMPSPLSVDLRERVVSAVAAGASCHQAAARFGVSVSSASRWSDRFRDCQEFRVRAAIVDPMEVLDGTTQSTPYP